MIKTLYIQANEYYREQGTQYIGHKGAIEHLDEKVNHFIATEVAILESITFSNTIPFQRKNKNDNLDNTIIFMAHISYQPQTQEK